MLLNYNLPNALHLPIVNKEGVIHKNVVLMPGVNTVDDADWENIKDHPKIVKRLEDNTLVIELAASSTKAGESTDDKEILRKLNIKKAIPLVKKTYDILLLQSWLQVEDRPGVFSEIEKQIEMVEAKAEKKED